jgi:D-glycero-D-manno-heptose 1,7-bisphosphate phosphatase
MSVVKLPENAVVNTDNVWCQVFARPEKGVNWPLGRPALFLDRDGVIVEEVNYLSRPEDVRLIDGAARIIAEANRKDIPVIVVTNQSGIARGFFGWAEFAMVQQKMLDDLAAMGASVDGVFACPHHKSGKAPFNINNHPARKPNPGMLLLAAETFGIDLSRSWIVGDKAGDLGAGRNAGIAGGVHVLTGHGNDDGEAGKALALATAEFPVHGIPAIGECATVIPFFG